MGIIELDDEIIDVNPAKPLVGEEEKEPSQNNLMLNKVGDSIEELIAASSANADGEFKEQTFGDKSK